MSVGLFAPSRSHVVLLDRGLNGPYGASKITSSLSSDTTHLNVSHNQLGNFGAVRLFQWLTKSEHVRNLKEIQLNSCGLGDMAVRAIGHYLSGNTTLEKLYLNGNDFTGDELVAADLVSAVNESHLKVLALSSNTLGDQFFSAFILPLRSTHLQALHLSMVGLTAASVPAVESFLSSARCSSLEHLTLNANSLGLAGVRSLVDAVQANNYTLLHLELDANNDQGQPGDQTQPVWTLKLAASLVRNKVLKLQVKHAAVQTLLYGRTLLQAQAKAHSLEEAETAPSDARPKPVCSPCMMTLPTELRLYILRFASDPTLVLSEAQFLRVVDYAASWKDQEVEGGHSGREAWLAGVGCTSYDARRRVG